MCESSSARSAGDGRLDGRAARALRRHHHRKLLPAGALSALYYADRIDQLPIGVIGTAAGTVILPEMARRIAAGDESGASSAQNRAIEFTLLLSLPCLAAFFVIPEN